MIGHPCSVFCTTLPIGCLQGRRNVLLSTVGEQMLMSGKKKATEIGIWELIAVTRGVSELYRDYQWCGLVLWKRGSLYQARHYMGDSITKSLLNNLTRFCVVYASLQCTICSPCLIMAYLMTLVELNYALPLNYGKLWSLFYKLLVTFMIDRDRANCKCNN